ncbi:MAG TPA: DinB family protein [Bacteroidia bacterium]|nr:DinB family protein [Bacteroidia bacterium]
MDSVKELLLTYAKYNLWANKALLGAIKKLDAAQLETETKSSFKSIRKTAFHIWDAEYVWLNRFKGKSLPFMTKDLPAATPVDSFIDGAQKFVEYVESQDDSFFTGVTIFKDLSGKEHTMENAGMLMHCMNHSSFHRGQIVTMLRMLGYEGEMPRTDMIVYLRELSH